MQNSTDTVTDLDLTGYVDGQLDDLHAARVEVWLATHPKEAAQVMHDIRMQRELRIAMSAPASTGVVQAQGRLARGLHRDAVIRRGLRFVPAQ